MCVGCWLLPPNTRNNGNFSLIFFSWVCDALTRQPNFFENVGTFGHIGGISKTFIL